MCTELHWTAYLTAMLTPTVALLGALIAFWQWRVAENKHKFELFDRRFTVFEAVSNFTASIMTNGKAHDVEIYNFIRATREAKWLFNSEVAEYIEKQLYYKALELQTLDAELKGVPISEERSKNVHAQADIKKWFAVQHAVIDKMFSPYLQLKL